MHVCPSCPDFFSFFLSFLLFFFLEALRGIHELCDGLSARVRHLNMDGHWEKGSEGLSSGASLFSWVFFYPLLRIHPQNPAHTRCLCATAAFLFPSFLF